MREHAKLVQTIQECRTVRQRGLGAYVCEFLQKGASARQRRCSFRHLSLQAGTIQVFFLLLLIQLFQHTVDGLLKLLTLAGPQLRHAMRHVPGTRDLVAHSFDCLQRQYYRTN